MSASFFSKLGNLFPATTQKIKSIFANFTPGQKINEKDLDQIRNLLLSIDCGTRATDKIINLLKGNQDDGQGNDLISRAINIVYSALKPYEEKLDIIENKLNIILVCGVNGTGKTSTIGKLGWHFKNTFGKKVLLAACDTFRAAAKEQLIAWANTCQLEIFSDDDKVSPSTVAYKSVLYAIEQKYDILFIDTAGRLNNDVNLMSELQKTVKVIKKLDPSAPHKTIMVLDANFGQNSYSQIEQFKAFSNIDTLIVTKLDSSSKAGILIGVADEYKLPISFIGIGEGKSDIKEFDALEYAKQLFL